MAGDTDVAHQRDALRHALDRHPLGAFDIEPQKFDPLQTKLFDERIEAPHRDAHVAAEQDRILDMIRCAVADRHGAIRRTKREVQRLYIRQAGPGDGLFQATKSPGMGFDGNDLGSPPSEHHRFLAHSGADVDHDIAALRDISARPIVQNLTLDGREIGRVKNGTDDGAFGLLVYPIAIAVGREFSPRISKACGGGHQGSETDLIGGVGKGKEHGQA